MSRTPRRVGIIGYGKLGQFLVNQIHADPLLELAFVWNRSQHTLNGEIDEQLILHNLDNFHKYNPDIVVEVAHPCISKDYGAKILKVMIIHVCIVTSCVRVKVHLHIHIHIFC